MEKFKKFLLRAVAYLTAMALIANVNFFEAKYVAQANDTFDIFITPFSNIIEYDLNGGTYNGESTVKVELPALTSGYTSSDLYFVFGSDNGESTGNEIIPTYGDFHKFLGWADTPDATVPTYEHTFYTYYRGNVAHKVYAVWEGAVGTTKGNAITNLQQSIDSVSYDFETVVDETIVNREQVYIPIYNLDADAFYKVTFNYKYESDTADNWWYDKNPNPNNAFWGYVVTDELAWDKSPRYGEFSVNFDNDETQDETTKMYHVNKACEYVFQATDINADNVMYLLFDLSGVHNGTTIPHYGHVDITNMQVEKLCDSPYVDIRSETFGKEGYALQPQTFISRSTTPLSMVNFYFEPVIDREALMIPIENLLPNEIYTVEFKYQGQCVHPELTDEQIGNAMYPGWAFEGSIEDEEYWLAMQNYAFQPVDATRKEALTAEYENVGWMPFAVYNETLGKYEYKAVYNDNPLILSYTFETTDDGSGNVTVPYWLFFEFSLLNEWATRYQILFYDFNIKWDRGAPLTDVSTFSLIGEELSPIEFDFSYIDYENLEWWPISDHDNQMPYPYEDYMIGFQPYDGYEMPEIIEVEIDNVIYEVYTDGTINEGEPYYDREENILTIPAELLTLKTRLLTIYVTAVEIDDKKKEKFFSVDDTDVSNATVKALNGLEAYQDGSDLEISVVPDDGYMLPEAFTVQIGADSYTIDTAVSEQNSGMVWDKAAGKLTIPYKLLDIENRAVKVKLNAVLADEEKEKDNDGLSVNIYGVENAVVTGADGEIISDSNILDENGNGVLNIAANAEYKLPETFKVTIGDATYIIHTEIEKQIGGIAWDNVAGKLVIPNTLLGGDAVSISIKLQAIPLNPEEESEGLKISIDTVVGAVVSGVDGKAVTASNILDADGNIVLVIVADEDYELPAEFEIVIGEETYVIDTSVAEQTDGIVWDSETGTLTIPNNLVESDTVTIGVKLQAVLIKKDEDEEELPPTDDNKPDDDNKAETEETDTEIPKEEDTEPPVEETPKEEDTEPPVEETPKEEDAEPPVEETPKEEDAEPPVDSGEDTSTDGNTEVVAPPTNDSDVSSGAENEGTGGTDTSESGGEADSGDSGSSGGSEGSAGGDSDSSGGSEGSAGGDSGSSGGSEGSAGGDSGSSGGSEGSAGGDSGSSGGSEGSAGGDSGSGE